jgi:hypothetical protein
MCDRSDMMGVGPLGPGNLTLDSRNETRTSSRCHSAISLATGTDGDSKGVNSNDKLLCHAVPQDNI